MQNNQISKKYFEYQLTKRCLEGRLEGFKISSWFLKIMKLVEYRIAKKFHDLHQPCRWLQASVLKRGCHVRFYVMKRKHSKSVTTVVAS